VIPPIKILENRRERCSIYYRFLWISYQPTFQLDPFGRAKKREARIRLIPTRIKKKATIYARKSGLRIIVAPKRQRRKPIQAIQ